MDQGFKEIAASGLFLFWSNRQKGEVMSEHDKLTAVLIVSMTLGALVYRITALSMIAGSILLWTLQNQPSVSRYIRGLFSFARGCAGIQEYRGDSTCKE